MVPNNQVTAPWPVPLSPTERHAIQQRGDDPDEWMALIVQVLGEGLAMGQPPAAPELIIVQATAAVPSGVFQPKSRLVALPETVPPVTVGGVSQRILVKRADVVEQMRVPLHDGWQVTVNWDTVGELTAEQERIVTKYSGDYHGSLETLTMHEAQALHALFPGSTVSPIVRPTLSTIETEGAERAAFLGAVLGAAVPEAQARLSPGGAARTASQSASAVHPAEHEAGEVPAESFPSTPAEVVELAALLSGRDPVAEER